MGWKGKEEWKEAISWSISMESRWWMHSMFSAIIFDSIKIISKHIEILRIVSEL